MRNDSRVSLADWPIPDGKSPLINSSLLFGIQNFLRFFYINISHSEKVAAKIQHKKIATFRSGRQLVDKCW